jgi:hypothetical protein
VIKFFDKTAGGLIAEAFPTFYPAVFEGDTLVTITFIVLRRTRGVLEGRSVATLRIQAFDVVSRTLRRSPGGY